MPEKRIWYCNQCGKDVETQDFKKHRGHKLKLEIQNVLEKENTD